MRTTDSKAFRINSVAYFVPAISILACGNENIESSVIEAL
jgi:hypothetical protein